MDVISTELKPWNGITSPLMQARVLVCGCQGIMPFMEMLRGEIGVKRFCFFDEPGKQVSSGLTWIWLIALKTESTSKRTLEWHSPCLNKLMMQAEISLLTTWLDVTSLALELREI